MSSPLSPSPRLLLQFRGSMIGALVGDCLGRKYEFNFYRNKLALPEFMSQLLCGKSTENLEYTDDTAMTISIAKSLIEKKELDPRDLAEKFANDYLRDPNRCYGAHVVNVFLELSASKFKDVFLPANRQFNGAGSFGNGAAMRISPVALFGSVQDESYLKNAVVQSSRVTHTHPNGYNGAILLALAIKAALKSDPQNELDPVDFINQLLVKMTEIEEIKDDKSPYCDKLKQMKDIYLQKKEDMSGKEIATYLGNDEIAIDSVPTAVYCFLRGLRPIPDFESSNLFVRTVYFAITVGGDADTIASMAGSIAGAYCGVEGIPSVITERCEKFLEVNQLAEDLYHTAVRNRK